MHRGLHRSRSQASGVLGLDTRPSSVQAQLQMALRPVLRAFERSPIAGQLRADLLLRGALAGPRVSMDAQRITTSIHRADLAQLP